jgi:hypothetical protein
MKKRLTVFLSALIICSMAAAPAVGQGLLYNRGQYALSAGFSQTMHHGTGGGSIDGTEVSFGGTVAGTVDLGLVIIQATGSDKTAYGFSGELFALKEKELGLPLTIGLQYGYIIEREGQDSYTAGATFYKSAQMSKRISLFPFIGESFAVYPGGRLPRESFFHLGLLGAYKPDKSSYLVLFAGWTVWRIANFLSLGFQLNFG